ncbi:MAG TPA: hypothetical protein VMT49_07115 [Steroidobacteraceae bacterium]|nr:hypothetical protein [Steroidobacteraceae bacterium]
MTDPAAQAPYRHPVVYRTVRGAALSGGRAAPGIVRAALPPPPGPVGETFPVQRAGAADVIDVEATGRDDAAGLYDARRYSEPND